MRNIVYDKKGFTLLEALVGIMLMGVLITLCMYFIYILKENTDDMYYQKETMLFVSQIQEDLIESKEIISKDKEIVLVKYDGVEVEYMFKNNSLVRQVKGKGNEVMLTKVKDIRCNLERNVIGVDVIYTNDKRYKFTVGGI